MTKSNKIDIYKNTNSDNMEKITNDLFKNNRLNLESTRKILGGADSWNSCTSNTSDAPVGCYDTRTITTDDDGKVTSDRTIIFCE
jgi:hypothetical protein